MKQIRVDREAHMKNTITKLDEHNESINFTQSILGNYFLETSLNCYNVEELIPKKDTQSELLQFTQTGDNDCTIVGLNDNLLSNINLDTNFWSLYFDISKM